MVRKSCWMIARKGSSQKLEAIASDSCNVNTGWEEGMMNFVEEKLQRKLDVDCL